MREGQENKHVKLIEEANLEPEDIIWTGGAGARVLCGIDYIL